YYIASGLAAGAGVMCHSNVVYMILAVGLLILLGEGWSALRRPNLYLFGLSAFAVSAYEVIYDLIDYRNFALQNRGDDVHFRVLSPGGFWQNLLEERVRYGHWYTGSVLFEHFPQPTLHIFQALAVCSVIYLASVTVRSWRGGTLLEDPRVRVFVVIVVV